MLQVIGMIVVVIGASGLVRKAYRIMQADAYVQQGMAYYSRKHFQPAISLFSNALSRNPRNTRALYYQASAHRLLQQPDQAITTYLRLLALDPFFLQANYHLGGIYARQRDLEHATTCFETQIAVDNMHWKSYYNLALLELHQSHNDQAILYLEEIEHIHSIQQVDEQIVQRARDLLTRLRPETASTL
jgi:tetratricopeptide (TPR) repeat protein